MPSIKLPQGTKDILPKEHQYFTYFKKVVRHRCRHAGFRRFTTPVFEKIDIFKKSYDLSDEELNNLFCVQMADLSSCCLVYDRIPPLIRAYRDNNMKDWAQPVELYFIEPLFKRDLDSKYEYFQSQSFGVAVMGECDPAIDAQVIQLLYQILQDLGLGDLVKFSINNVGAIDDQIKYAEALKDFYIGKERSLCQTCNHFLHIKPLKLLSCEHEDCKILAHLAPKFDQFLSKESNEYMQKLKDYLTGVSIPFEENKTLFLSAPYFTNLVFEVVSNTAKIQETIISGGRCDSLSKKMDIEDSIPSFGATMNIDAVLAIMKKEKIQVPAKDNLHLFVAQLGPEAKEKCLKLITDLREVGIKCVGALGKGSMKEQLYLAQQFKVTYTALMGMTEVKEGVIIIRNMEKGVQHKVPYDKAIEEVVKLIGESNLDKYHPGELIYG